LTHITVNENSRKLFTGKLIEGLHFSVLLPWEFLKTKKLFRGLILNVTHAFLLNIYILEDVSVKEEKQLLKNLIHLSFQIFFQLFLLNLIIDQLIGFLKQIFLAYVKTIFI
jgi:hypothetical protein